MDAKETLKYLYEHGHIISGENYKIIKNELNENARLKALLSHSKTQLEYDELQAENESLCNLVEDVRAEAHQVKEDYRTDAVLQAENEKARLFRLEVQEAVEALIGCEDDKALRILEQALKDKDNG